VRRAVVVLAVLLGQMLLGQGLSAGAARAEDGTGRVALIGVSGLHWNDLTQADTPNLWDLARASAIGSLSVRTVGNVTCPYDGWLTVSAGTRSAVGYGCGAPPMPEQQGEGAIIPGYRYLVDVAGQRYAGTLGESLKAAGQCSIAIGPGAALGLADRQGAVRRYYASPLQAKTADLQKCRMIAMDVDDLIRPYLTGDRLPKVPEQLTAAQRRAALRLADAKAGAQAKVDAGSSAAAATVGNAVSNTAVKADASVGAGAK